MWNWYRMYCICPKLTTYANPIDSSLPLKANFWCLHHQFFTQEHFYSLHDTVYLFHPLTATDDKSFIWRPTLASRRDDSVLPIAPRGFLFANHGRGAGGMLK